MGISIDRAIRIQNWYKAEIDSIFRDAIYSKHSHAQILEQKRIRVFDRPDFKKTPNWVRSYLSGYSAAKMDELYTHYLEWRMYVPFRDGGGALCSRGEIDKLIINGDTEVWSRIRGELSTHTWKGFSNKPFNSKVVNEVISSDSSDR